MNRQQRRRMEKECDFEKLTKRVIERRIALGKRFEQEIEKQADNKLNTDRTLYMYTVCALALRNCFGFGQQRIAKWMQEVDDISGRIARYEISMDEVIERLEKEVQIKVEV